MRLQPHEPSTPALEVAGSSTRVTLTTTSAVGGNGWRTVPSSPAVRSTRASLVIAGDASAVLRAGQFDTEKLSTLTLHPSVSLVPSGGEAKILGFASVVTRPVPYLTRAGGSLGGQRTITLHSQDKHVYALFLSLSKLPVPIAPFEGTLWLDPALLLTAAAGAQRSTNQLTVSFTVPNQPAWFRVPLALQALSGDGKSFAFTNPVLPVLH